MRTISDTKKAKIFSFIPGKRYHITEAKHGGSRFDPVSQPSYTFEYVKRNNKLHVFREVNHGWLKGISDLQLESKNVQEVKN